MSTYVLVQDWRGCWRVKCTDCNYDFTGAVDAGDDWEAARKFCRQKNRDMRAAEKAERIAQFSLEQTKAIAAKEESKVFWEQQHKQQIAEAQKLLAGPLTVGDRKAVKAALRTLRLAKIESRYPLLP